MAMKELPIVIFIIGILVHLSAGSIPKSREKIEDTVLAGGYTTLHCSFEGNPLAVAWLKGESLPGNVIARYVGNGIIYPGNTEKYSVQKDFSSGKSSFSLTIADVELADAGRYRCAVTDQNGAISSRLYHLTVLVPPEHPYPRIIPMTPVNDDGQPINLTCRADGGSIGLVNLHWIYNDTRSIQRDTKSYPNADGTTENVSSVIVAYPSEKPYTCVATLNTSGKESATAFVNIRPRQGSTPTPTAPTPTQNTTSNGNDSANSYSDLWWIAGIAVVAVFAFVTIKVYRNRNPKAIQHRLPQRTSLGRTMYQLSPTTNKDDNEDDNENEEVNETVC